LIIRITNNDDLWQVYEISQPNGLEGAIQLAWQKITALRPDHFARSQAIQVMSRVGIQGPLSAAAQAKRELLQAAAIEAREVLPVALCMHLYNEHAYGASLAEAESVLTTPAGAVPGAWITVGHYPVAGESQLPAGTEQSISRRGNNLVAIWDRLDQASRHAALLVQINKIRRRALDNEF